MSTGLSRGAQVATLAVAERTERVVRPEVEGVGNLGKATPMPRWRVDILRKHAEHLGIVTAPNAQEALNRAASLFQIEPSRFNKLMIRKIEERERDRFID
jgi:hypothetical protein